MGYKNNEGEDEGGDKGDKIIMMMQCTIIIIYLKGVGFAKVI